MLCLTLANSGSEHLIGQEFAVLGLQLSALTTGQLFFYGIIIAVVGMYGIIIAVVGMLGLSLVLGACNRRLGSRAIASGAPGIPEGVPGSAHGP